MASEESDRPGKVARPCSGSSPAAGAGHGIEYALSDEQPAHAIALDRTSKTQKASLTRREEEVAALVAQGLTNRRIAEELSISEHTVATHVGKAMKKLGLGSRSQFAAWLAERQR